MIDKYIKALVEYSIKNNLIDIEERIYSINLILSLLNLDTYTDVELKKEYPLEDILNNIVEYAYENGIIRNKNIIEIDLFESKLMNTVTPRPKTVIEKFQNLYDISPRDATDFYYKFSQDTNYIKRDKIKRDRKWKVDTEFGELDITINLSKPEKDPKLMKLLSGIESTNYPKCFLCRENEGYSGNLRHPGRQNHRIIPISINNKKWYLQYSPYVYYNEHCILLSERHSEMKINKDTFKDILYFVDRFPHYFLGSNAGLPIVGGSILDHIHYQGGRYEFPLAKASIEKNFNIEKLKDIELGIVKWPMSVIRLRSKGKSKIVELADEILKRWKDYTNEDLFIYSETNGEQHNTITPIARKIGDIFELDIVLRNNKTTEDRTYGIFHPREEYHNIKKENIGLIEVSGLAVLPSRLKYEMEILKNYILEDRDISSNVEIAKHDEWVNKFRNKYEFNSNNIDGILKYEIGSTFCEILKDAAVFKRDGKGKIAFEEFVNMTFRL